MMEEERRQRTLEQNKKLHACLAQAGVDKEGKEALVWTYTKERSKSSKDLTVEECNALIAFLIQTYKLEDEGADKPQKPSFQIKFQGHYRMIQKLKYLGVALCGYKEYEVPDWKNRVIPYLIKALKLQNWEEIKQKDKAFLSTKISVLEKALKAKQEKQNRLEAECSVGDLLEELNLKVQDEAEKRDIHGEDELGSAL